MVHAGGGVGWGGEGGGDVLIHYPKSPPWTGKDHYERVFSHSTKAKIRVLVPM